MKIKLDHAAREYSRKELVDLFGTKADPKTTKADLFRSLIDNALIYPESDELRSFRHFWYHPIKPILGILGYLDKESDSDDPTRRMSQCLSKYVAQGVAKGKFTYRDLLIEDESRERHIAADLYDYVTFGRLQYTITGKVYPEIILAVEKDTIYRPVAQIARRLGCSAISGSGQEAFSAMEALLRRSAEDIDDSDITILTLTDYDPSGYDISQTFVDHAEATVRNLGMSNTVSVHRIGIEPDQLSDEEIERERYPIPVSSKKKKMTDRWLAETNGINGELYGLELDALSRRQVRELFVSEMQRFITQDDLLDKEAMRQAYLANIVQEAIQDQIQEIVSNITDRIYDEEKDSIVDTSINIFELVTEDQRLFIDQCFETDREDEISEKAVEYYEEIVG